MPMMSQGYKASETIQIYWSGWISIPQNEAMASRLYSTANLYLSLSETSNTIPVLLEQAVVVSLFKKKEPLLLLRMRDYFRYLKIFLKCLNLLIMIICITFKAQT
jgi:hypothetical protein